MAQVVYSAQALDDLGQALEPASAAAIQSAVENLSDHPLVGRRVEGDLRELIISFGATGYVALYRFLVLGNEVRVLALRHQKDVGYLP
jgi:plasmid stabilization system protein ParE